MPKVASPRRYAQAVFQIALEHGRLDEWHEELRTLALAMEQRELAGLLDAPQVSVVRKLEIVKQTLGDSVGPLATNLMSLLASRQLAHLLPGVLDGYDRLVDAYRGIERAEVVSAMPLDKGQQARIEELLKGMVGKDVRVTSSVDPRVLGGLVARVGDRVIDGSLSTKLREMRRSLLGQAS